MGILHSHHTISLSESNLELCKSVFAQIDTENNHQIDLDEAKEWWKNNYAVINCRAMFNDVDVNHDGIIDLNEWVRFWTLVRNKGHSDEDITEELLNIKSKLSWVHIDGVSRLIPNIKD